ncbi:hypothetical protein BH11PLA2_BH11PLA2_42710 [soil metagenome]
MIQYLTIEDVLELHDDAIAAYGGSPGIRDRGLIESAVVQPQTQFFGQEQYPTMADKVAALGFALICNHSFIDGNKRIGYFAMDTFLRMNGFKIGSSLEDQHAHILAVASGVYSRVEFTAWVTKNIVAAS